MRHLIEIQNQDGGWGAYAGQPARTESTALATLAVASGGPTVGDAAIRGADWLVRAQAEDGSWPAGPGLPSDSWHTGLATLALALARPAAEAASRGGAWLLSQEGSRPSWFDRLLLRLGGRGGEVALDPDLVGWPWHDGTFSWVEPTSYALLALKRPGIRVDAGRREKRVDLAERMLIDRECEGGGWNYGNTRVLDEALWPYPDTTAAALWALYDRPDLPAVTNGFAALDRMLGSVRSLLTLSLAAVCRRAHGRPIDDVEAEIAERLDQPTGFMETRALALGSLALAPEFPWED